MNAPETVEGALIWGLVTRLSGQIRIVAGMAGNHVIGWDMTAALAMGEAMGLPRWLVAEVLPDIEFAMTRNLNKRNG